MKSAVCTLFEGQYHYGLGALVNSLALNGFSGNIYAGFRGPLPIWANGVCSESLFGEFKVFEMAVTPEIRLVFINLETDYHFTNYKPDFILDIFGQEDFLADALFYIDPDIVVNAEWKTFERWVNHGVALCEDVNSPMPSTHPVRAAWRSYFKEHAMKLNSKGSVYVNGGFVGVKRSDLRFIREWQKIQEAMALSIGGLSRSSLAGKPLDQESSGVFAPFSKTDQDALNVTIEVSDTLVSVVGKENMGFINGRAILPHALGQPKPWTKKPISQSISGYPPRFVDKLYWENVVTPIRIYPKYKVVAKSLAYKVAILISRFYKRN